MKEVLYSPKSLFRTKHMLDDIEIATMLHEKAATPFCFLSAMAFLSHSNQSHFLKEGLK